MRRPSAQSGPRDVATGLRTPADLDPLLERIGNARYVLLGEASHGTHEFYRWRAEITRRLIETHGFSFIAVEGDWPDCFEVNAWVRGFGDDSRDAAGVLEGFDRWPTWMWANQEVADFITWLRAHNEHRTERDRIGFYGFDVYSLWESMREVVAYLETHEPEAIDTARQAFRCFEPYREDPQAYARATRMVPISCEQEVVDLLARVCGDRVVPDLGGATPWASEHRFAAEQNAAVARNAERYYRAMVRGGAESWNVRDTHMVDTLDRLMDHHGPTAKAVVWAHNTHIGDARATDMADAGMVNVGQLVRERHGEDGVVAVGFSGHRGSVIAGSSWGAAMERMAVPAARSGSVEDLLHRELGGDALLVFPRREQPEWLTSSLSHRAVGVVYDPQRERWGNYVPTVMGQRYDALLHFEQTSALRPLGPEAPAPHEELETFPHGT